MNRNEIRGLIALVVLIAFAIGARSWQSRQRSGIWVESATQSPTVAAPRRVSLPAIPPAPPGSTPTAPALDLNQASEAQLDALPLIGEARAREIVAYRTARGRFLRADELRELLRLSDTNWRRLQPLVCVTQQQAASAAPSATPAVAEPAPPRQSPVAETPAPVAPVAAATPAAAETGSPSPQAVASPPVILATAAPAPPAASPGVSRVNINTASATELEDLWRIGPTLAKRIVQWRTQNGAFATPEDLMRVPGIGPAILARNRARITVGP